MVITRKDILYSEDWWPECPLYGPTRVAVCREGHLPPHPGRSHIAEMSLMGRQDPCHRQMFHRNIFSSKLGNAAR